MPIGFNISKLSLQDALDLAIHIEKEAEERYEQFADMLGVRYKGDAAEFFLEMAKNEKKHGEELTKRRKALFGNAPVRIDSGKIWDVEAPDFDRPDVYMSPRQAAKVALDSETKAHHFFRDALLQIKDESVRALFEELRNEELNHQKMVKALLERLPAGDGPDREEDDIDEPPAL